MKMYTIGQTAKLVNLSSKTIRFYEDSGVIQPTTRAENGYRLYPETVIKELTLIGYARELGLPLSEIKKLLIGCEHDSCEHTQAYVANAIESYVSLLTAKIEQLTYLKEKLVALKNKIKLTEENCDDQTYCCNILSQLAE